MTLVAASFVRAGAMTLGSGELDGGPLGVGIEASQGAAPVRSTRGHRRCRALVHYASTPLAGGRPGDLGNLCNAGGAGADDRRSCSAGSTTSSRTRATAAWSPTRTSACRFPIPNDQSQPPPPPALPVPPTVGDVWRAVALPRPVVGVNPVSRGVTGLDTWLWSGGAQTAQVAVTIGGFRVTGIARVVEYRFFTDEGYLGATAVAGRPVEPGRRAPVRDEGRALALGRVGVAGERDDDRARRRRRRFPSTSTPRCSPRPSTIPSSEVRSRLGPA